MSEFATTSESKTVTAHGIFNNIRKNDVLEAYEEMSDSGLSNGSIQNIHINILFPAFQMAVDNDWLRKNPAKDCLKEYPYDAMDKRDALTVQQQKRFIDFLAKDKIYSKYLFIVLLILETGLRRGEVLGLTWKDIDFDEGVLIVDHQLHYYREKKKCVFAIGDPKTDAGFREIPLSKQAVSILKKVKQKDYFGSMSSSIKIDGYSGFIFLNSQKTNVLIPRQLGDSLTAARKKFNKIESEQAKREGREPERLPNITPHILRHTACTRMIERGMDIKVVQKIMGHKSVQITLDIYTHTEKERIREEIKKMDAVEPLYLLG